MVGQQLELLPTLPPFQRLLSLLTIFQQLATSQDRTLLHGKPVTNAYKLSEQQRLKQLQQFIDENYQRKIDIADAAAVTNLTLSAFCRYVKRMTRLTFTQFLNQYRIHQAQKLLLLDHTVTEACFAGGFESLSYFNRTFRRVTGENPLQFKKRHRA
ncbi:helix-turn-helix domain-containing protein [Spirosoma areae]